MTHDTDCSVLDEYRDDLNQMAEYLQANQRDEAQALADKHGWHEIGGGAGRAVWQVSPGKGSRGETVVESAPCVVKFAAGGGIHGGERQNRQEIAQFSRFPPEITDADPPVVVPLKDWARDEQSWVAMPRVDETGGSPNEVERELNRHGWSCSADLKFENVGSIHGHSVLLDYAIGCEEVAPVKDIASEFDRIDEKYADDIRIDFDQDRQEATVNLKTPNWMAKEGHTPLDSEVFIEAGVGVQYIDAVFGPFPMAEEETAEVMASNVSEHIYNYDHAVEEVLPNVVESDDGISVNFEIRIMRGRGGPMGEGLVMPGYDGVKLWEEMVQSVEDEMEAAEDPVSYAEDMSLIFRDEPAGLGGFDSPEIRNIFTDRSRDEGILRFEPPADAPGVGRPVTGSRFIVDGGFRELRAVFGPWRDDEPQSERIAADARSMLRDMESEWRGLDFFWRTNEVSANQVTGSNHVELLFYAEPEGASALEDPTRALDISPRSAVEMYEDVYEAAKRHLPPGRESGGPPQSEIDEFPAGVLDEIDSGIQAAICPTGDRCDAQAEALSADLYEHVHGDGQFDNSRINEAIRDMIDRNFDSPGDVSATGGAVTVEQGGDTLASWDFTDEIIETAMKAPDEMDPFIETVSADILDAAEDALLEAEKAAKGIAA